MVAFFLVRIQFTFPGGLSKNLDPSEYFQFRIPRNKLFLWLHLVSVLPAALLAVLQFVPRIRARAMGFHRTAGKVINILTFISTITAWGIAHVSFGGDLTVRTGTYVLGIMTLWSTVASWKAIRRLQIDEHRAWLIRAWGYQMCIVTMRAIMPVSLIGIHLTGGFFHSISCQEIEYLVDNTALYARDYPQCQAGWPGPSVTHMAVEAKLDLDNKVAIAAALKQTFGMSIWVALWIHAVGVEYYLHRTRDESARLRELSTKRQNARRMLKERNAEL
ncbi:hypothetical protein BDV93DRAFT_505811 [Ceratobasidium sp. AG-I]|nr:hypothetical protein BDV93DRAFT_505811 [Ceratobasidium sp. AG-I]